MFGEQAEICWLATHESSNPTDVVVIILLTSGPTKSITLIMHRMTYSFSAESGFRNAENKA